MSTWVRTGSNEGISCA